MLTFLLGSIPGAGPVLAFLQANPLIKGIINGTLILVGVLLVGWAIHHHGYSAGLKHERAKWEAAAAKLQAQNTKAQAAADAQRATDTATVTASAKGRSDAIQAGADEAPSATQHRADCQRLRAHYGPKASLPGCD
jgi:hypothetical protein